MLNSVYQARLIAMIKPLANGEVCPHLRLIHIMYFSFSPKSPAIMSQYSRNSLKLTVKTIASHRP